VLLARLQVATDYTCIIYGVISLQAKFRQRRAIDNYTRLIRLRNDKAATLVQSCWRSFRLFADYTCLIYGIISFQAKVRQRRAMIEYTGMLHLRNDKAATLVQRSWRSYKAHVDYLYMVYGVVCLQAKFRQRRAMIEYTKTRYLLEVNNSAVRIQSRWRLCKAVAEYRNVIVGITRIQSCWRSYKAQVVYDTVIWSAVLIQTTYRCHLLGCKARLLQVLTRGADIQTRHTLSVFNIQEGVRRMIAQKKAKLLRVMDFIHTRKLCDVKAATIIHCFWRQHLLETSAATAIQAFARSIKCQQVLLELRLARKILRVITLQAVVRSWICRRQVVTLKHEAQKARLIEYAAARSIIKSFVRSYTSRREEKLSHSVSIDSKPKELAVDSSTMTTKKLLLQQRNKRIEFVRKNRRSSVRPPRSPTSAATDLLPSS
jgi:hypothetical protein